MGGQGKPCPFGVCSTRPNRTELVTGSGRDKCSLPRFHLFPCSCVIKTRASPSEPVVSTVKGFGRSIFTAAVVIAARCAVIVAVPSWSPGVARHGHCSGAQQPRAAQLRCPAPPVGASANTTSGPRPAPCRSAAARASAQPPACRAPIAALPSAPARAHRLAALRVACCLLAHTCTTNAVCLQRQRCLVRAARPAWSM